VTNPTAYAFFYEHAGYSHDPKTETAEAGRARGATALAAAEAAAAERGWAYEWENDPETSAADYGDEDGEYDYPADQEFSGCVLRDANGKVLGSLWGIDDADPNGYGRVVEAELALEALGEIERYEAAAIAEMVA
jgi:hypothetical protein